MRCSVFDEGLDAQCTTRASMVRTVIKDGEFPACTYYCQEHGEAHGAVLIAVAGKIRGLRDRDKHMRIPCDRALLGNESAIEECMDAIAQAGAR